MHIEFPKYLVKDEDFCIVNDHDEDKAARAKGFAMAGEAVEVGKKRGAKTSPAPE